MDSLQPNNILHSFLLPKMTKFFCFEIHRYKVFCTLCANHVFADGFFLFVKVKEISLTDIATVHWRVQNSKVQKLFPKSN